MSDDGTVAAAAPCADDSNAWPSLRDNLEAGLPPSMAAVWVVAALCCALSLALLRRHVVILTAHALDIGRWQPSSAVVVALRHRVTIVRFTGVVALVSFLNVVLVRGWVVWDAALEVCACFLLLRGDAAARRDLPPFTTRRLALESKLTKGDEPNR